jgi:hypothetical protein
MVGDDDLKIVERHADKKSGKLSSLGRMVITGNISVICHVDGMSGNLRYNL